MTEPHELLWDPLSPDEVAALFAGWDRFWCIAGGWAVDLVAGRQSREHGDTDVLVLRWDVDAVHDQLPGWELHAADPPGSLRLWAPNEPLPGRVHDIWCREEGSTAWRFQLMVMDHDDVHWIFRRNRRMGGRLVSLSTIVDGVPVIAPEVQLLFKGTSTIRPMDDADFRMMLPHLSPEQRAWLSAALRTCDPDHPWAAAI